jgi:hypothetical protein
VDPRRVYSALVFFPLFYVLVRHLPAAAFAVFVAIGILLGVSVVFSRAVEQVRVPVVLVFLAIGMLAGSEGIGRIAFENYQLAYRLGTAALVFILFDGGLSRSWRGRWAGSSVLANGRGAGPPWRRWSACIWAPRFRRGPLHSPSCSKSSSRFSSCLSSSAFPPVRRKRASWRVPRSGPWSASKPSLPGLLAARL